MADNCQYWIGECYYGLRQYQKAIIEFQKVFAYSATDKHDDAQLMIGLSYFRLGQRDQAQSEFQTFLNNFADSEYSSIARRYVQDI
jgi:TolA-binding protein